MDDVGHDTDELVQNVIVELERRTDEEVAIA
jgi:hypothetical protein